MRRRLVILVPAVVSLLCGPALGEEPAAAGDGVKDVLTRICRAMERKDVEGVVACYSDHYLTSASPHTKGEVRRDLQKLFSDDAEVSCSFEPLEQWVSGDRALMVAREELRIKGGGASEDHARSERVKFKLSRGEEGWRIVSMSRLIADEPSQPAGRDYTVASHGVRFPLPEGWHAFLVEAGPGTGNAPPELHLESPDLKAQITVSMQSLPVPLAPEALVDIFQCRMNACVPDCEIKQREIRVGKGESTIRFDVLMPGSDLAELCRTFIRKHDDDLQIFTLDVLRREQVAEYEPVFQGLVGGVQQIPPAPLPPSRGTLTGRTYTNAVYGCRIEFPPGWEARISRALNFCAVAESPDKKIVIIAGGLRLPGAASAGELLDGDDAFAAQLDPSFELLRRGKIDVNGEEGAESVSVFEIGAPRKKRWRVYFVRDDVLYAVVCDAAPPEAFDEHEGALQAAVHSFRLLPPAENAEAPTPSSQ